MIRGLQAQASSACGKHFPGHGDTSSDSHEELPVVEHDRRRLDAVELVPFRAAIEAGVATIMTAHVLVPALDADHPASFSPRIVTDLLKTTLATTGVVISDDLGMKAISATVPLPDATVAAIHAGCDVVLLCNTTIDEQVTALEAIIRAAESGRLSQHADRRRVRAAAARQGTLPRAGCPAGHGARCRRMRGAPGGRRGNGGLAMTPRTRVRPRQVPAVRAGSRVALVAPASPFDRAEFDAGVAELRRLGFEPVFDDASSTPRLSSPARRRRAPRR